MKKENFSLYEEISLKLHENLRIWTHQLYREFDNICYSYSLKLSTPTIKITSMERSWGEWRPLTRTIVIAHKLITSFSWDAVIEVLKHEIAHMIVHEVYLLPDSNHGTHFQKAAKSLGISAWASASDADMQSSKPFSNNRSLSPDDERVLKKVEKLLKLASSSNEHEAYLAMKRVKEISEKYNVEKLIENNETKYTYIIINHLKKIVPQYQSMIANILNKHFFVEVIFSSLYNQKRDETHKILEILGKEENVKMSEYVYHFLNNNLPVLWSEYKKRTKKMAKAKKSYYLGVLMGFDEKLTKESATPTPSKRDDIRGLISYNNNQALIQLSSEKQKLIVKAKKELNQYLRYRHPKISTRSWDTSLRDPDSFRQGKKDGKGLTFKKGLNKTEETKVFLLT